MFSIKWVVNLLLLGAAVFLGMKAWEDWHKADAEIPEAPAARPVEIELPGKTLKLKRNPTKHYDVVVEKNLFSSKREETQPVEPAPVGKKKKPKPNKKARVKSSRVVLYGVVSLGADKKALVQDPTRRARNKKNTSWVRTGDEVAGMTVSRIETGKILLNDGSEDYEVLLYDSSKPKPRTAARRPAGPTIIATGTGRASAASKVGRPTGAKQTAKTKKKSQKPKLKQPPKRVTPKKKTTAKKNTARTTSSSGRTSSSGGAVKSGSNPFESLFRRE